jgi:hypothetical protein
MVGPGYQGHACIEIEIGGWRRQARFEQRCPVKHPDQIREPRRHHPVQRVKSAVQRPNQGELEAPQSQCQMIQCARQIPVTPFHPQPQVLQAADLRAHSTVTDFARLRG